MKFTRIEGPAQHLTCAGCQYEGIGGTEAYRSAATGKDRAPDEWYQVEDPLNFTPYCTPCAAKIAEGEDSTRSVRQFFADTTGTEVKPENLPDN